MKHSHSFRQYTGDSFLLDYSQRFVSKTCEDLIANPGIGNHQGHAGDARTKHTKAGDAKHETGKHTKADDAKAGTGKHAHAGDAKPGTGKQTNPDNKGSAPGGK